MKTLLCFFYKPIWKRILITKIRLCIYFLEFSSRKVKKSREYDYQFEQLNQASSLSYILTAGLYGISFRLAGFSSSDIEKSALPYFRRLCDRSFPVSSLNYHFDVSQE